MFFGPETTKQLVSVIALCPERCVSRMVNDVENVFGRARIMRISWCADVSFYNVPMLLSTLAQLIGNDWTHPVIVLLALHSNTLLSNDLYVFCIFFRSQPLNSWRLAQAAGSWKAFAATHSQTLQVPWTICSSALNISKHHHHSPRFVYNTLQAPAKPIQKVFLLLEYCRLHAAYLKPGKAIWVKAMPLWRLILWSALRYGVPQWNVARGAKPWAIDDPEANLLVSVCRAHHPAFYAEHASTPFITVVSTNSINIYIYQYLSESIIDMAMAWIHQTPKKAMVEPRVRWCPHRIIPRFDVVCGHP